MRLAALLLFLPLTAQADAPISAAEFEALSTGKTLHFRSGLGLFGAEQYFDNRRVRWMYSDGTCTDGYWYPEGDALCFVYEDVDSTQCWHMSGTGTALRAERADIDDPAPIFLDHIDTRPLACPGPDLGV